MLVSLPNVQVHRAAGASPGGVQLADSDTDDDGPQARAPAAPGCWFGVLTGAVWLFVHHQAPPSQELYPESRLQMAWPNVFKARYIACSALRRVTTSLCTAVHGADAVAAIACVFKPYGGGGPHKTARWAPV